VSADSAVARGIRSVIASWKQGLDWKEARKNLLKEVPDAFFYTYMDPENREPDLPRGRTGFDAPANVGIFVLGWLYGEDDFGKSLCVATGCGEDTDCTAATLGATLGIIHGIDAIPQNWKDPIGNKIVTISLNRGDLGHIFPNTVQELTERVIRLAPRFIDDVYVDLVNAKEGYGLMLHEGEALYNKPREVVPGIFRTFEEDVLSKQPFSVRFETPIYTVWLKYGQEPLLKSGEAIKIGLQFENMLRKPQWLTLSWHVPQGWSVAPASQVNVSLTHPIGGWVGVATAEFTISAEEIKQARSDLFIDVQSDGHHTHLVIPVTLLSAADGVAY
jgi:hypothetical protein